MGPASAHDARCVLRHGVCAERSLHRRKIQPRAGMARTCCASRPRRPPPPPRDRRSHAAHCQARAGPPDARARARTHVRAHSARASHRLQPSSTLPRLHKSSIDCGAASSACTRTPRASASRPICSSAIACRAHALAVCAGTPAGTRSPWSRLAPRSPLASRSAMARNAVSVPRRAYSPSNS